MHSSSTIAMSGADRGLRAMDRSSDSMSSADLV
jgi:hypothetical protein